MSEWSEVFGQLRQQFVTLTEERLETMEKLLSRLEEMPYDPALMTELMRHFHSLKGSGASYGYEKVTALCRKAQEECQAFIESQSRPTSADLNHWRDTVVSLKMEIGDPPQSMGTPDQSA